MAGATHPTVRFPAVAGTFYPVDRGDCHRQANLLLDTQKTALIAPSAEMPTAWQGAIVPHAGWMCSGAIAARSIAALSQSQPAPDVVVVFGAVHTPIDVDFAALDSHDAWSEPGSETRVATDISRKLSERGLFEVEERLHRHEHAIEVELPLISATWPDAMLLPIEVPAIDQAATIGRQVAAEIAASGRRPVFLASSDLTHYGPAYRFTPAGVGVKALQWAKDNDRRLLDRVTALAADEIVSEARAHANACGAGAIAAMLAACRERGATTAQVLWHANSYETLAVVHPQRPIDAVGYAAVVVG